MKISNMLPLTLAAALATLSLATTAVYLPPAPVTIKISCIGLDFAALSYTDGIAASHALEVSYNKAYMYPFLGNVTYGGPVVAVGPTFTYDSSSEPVKPTLVATLTNLRWRKRRPTPAPTMAPVPTKTPVPGLFRGTYDDGLGPNAWRGDGTASYIDESGSGPLAIPSIVAWKGFFVTASKESGQAVFAPVTTCTMVKTFPMV